MESTITDPIKDVDFIVELIGVATDVLKLGEDELSEDDISKIVLEADRLRAALYFRKYGIPDCKLAPTGGHQPSCDGNCIATRGQPKDVEEELLECFREDLQQLCDDSMREVLDEHNREALFKAIDDTAEMIAANTKRGKAYYIFNNGGIS